MVIKNCSFPIVEVSAWLAQLLRGWPQYWLPTLGHRGWLFGLVSLSPLGKAVAVYVPAVHWALLRRLATTACLHDAKSKWLDTNLMVRTVSV